MASGRVFGINSLGFRRGGRLSQLRSAPPLTSPRMEAPLIDDTPAGATGPVHNTQPTHQRRGTVPLFVWRFGADGFAGTGWTMPLHADYMWLCSCCAVGVRVGPNNMKHLRNRSCGRGRSAQAPSPRGCKIRKFVNSYMEMRQERAADIKARRQPPP